jgi:hypothetical protein
MLGRALRIKTDFTRKTNKNMQLTDKEKEAQKLIIESTQKAMDLLLTHLNSFCTTTGAVSIPMVYIESSVKILMEGLRKGIETQETLYE